MSDRVHKDARIVDCGIVKGIPPTPRIAVSTPFNKGVGMFIPKLLYCRRDPYLHGVIIQNKFIRHGVDT